MKGRDNLSLDKTRLSRAKGSGRLLRSSSKGGAASLFGTPRHRASTSQKSPGLLRSTTLGGISKRRESSEETCNLLLTALLPLLPGQLPIARFREVSRRACGTLRVMCWCRFGAWPATSSPDASGERSSQCVCFRWQGFKVVIRNV